MDVDPPLSDGARYMREDMSLQGYRHLLAVGAPCRTFTSLDHVWCTDALYQCSAESQQVVASLSAVNRTGCVYRIVFVYVVHHSGWSDTAFKHAFLQHLWMAWSRRAGKAVCALALPTTSPA